MKITVTYTDGTYTNIPADGMDLRDGLILAWLGEALVLVARVETVKEAHLSEKA